MRVTQGTFSYLPDLTEEELAAQIRYALDRGWVVGVEYTDDPHPRNHYWHMWGLPMFDVFDPAAVLYEIGQCRAAFPNHYVKVTAYDPSHTRQTTALAIIVQRPAEEPGFRLERQEGADRQMRYTLHAYASERPHGERYRERP